MEDAAVACFFEARRWGDDGVYECGCVCVNAIFAIVMVISARVKNDDEKSRRTQSQGLIWWLIRLRASHLDHQVLHRRLCVDCRR